eukprot:Nk52_evm9s639 gene=Nk52_evmTU9s639
MPGVTVKDVDSHQFVKAYAQFLKRSGKIEVPKWIDIVKTGAHKELSPYDPDWFYVRCAAIARHVYLRNPVGVGALRKVFGATRNNGARPSHHCNASGSIIRVALQQLEKVRVVEKDSTNGGRRISNNGQRDLDRIACQVVAKN